MQPAEHYRGREQTYLKHFFLERYLERVAYKVGSFVPDFVYVEGFSGPWRSEAPGHADSSFVVAIKKLREVRVGLAQIGKTPRVRCVFVEPDAESFALLRAATAAVTDIEIKIINAEFEAAIPEVLEFVGSAFSLVFIDPTGWTGFGLRQIRPILQHRPGEVLVNFMFDHINRFIDAEETAMSFDDLFGGPGWKDIVSRADSRREDAIVGLYTDRMKVAGEFSFVTSTRIMKPLSERSYFYLIYGTRHPDGLVEFRSVEKKEVAEQERVRLDAQQIERIGRTGQPELFDAQELAGTGPPSLVDERRLRLQQAEAALIALLQHHHEVDYEDARATMLEFPLVWETDVKRVLGDRYEVIGLGPRERTPKPGHHIRARQSG